MEKLLPEIKVAPPGPKAKAIIETDSTFASPSYIKEYPLVVDRGQGPWIYDVDGNRYLDMMAGIATASTGHSHPKVVEAIHRSSEKFLHICATDFYYESKAKLLKKLSNYVPKMGQKKVFLSNSGTEAVEGSLKLARFHTKRPNIIAFKGAFHGRTYGAITLNASKANQKAFFGPLLPGVFHIPFYAPNSPAHYDPKYTLEKELFVSTMDPKEVAAIIVEPILGEGGYVMPHPEMLKDLRRICDLHGILLIFDEIQCGVGRTGHMYASELFDVAPDIYLTAKGIASGMPIGAIIAKESVMTWPRGSHGSTYGGNPVCCDAALATLDIVEGLLPQVRSVGEVLLKGLRDLQKKYPIIGDVRGTGLMVGCEFLDPKTKEPAAKFVGDLEQLAFRKGLLLLGCGKSTIRFAPPLVVTDHEIKVCLEILESCFKELQHG